VPHVEAVPSEVVLALVLGPLEPSHATDDHDVAAGRHEGLGLLGRRPVVADEQPRRRDALEMRDQLVHQSARVGRVGDDAVGIVRPGSFRCESPGCRACRLVGLFPSNPWHVRAARLHPRNRYEGENVSGVGRGLRRQAGRRRHHHYTGRPGGDHERATTSSPPRSGRCLC
jgi:hypothetical protein